MEPNLSIRYRLAGEAERGEIRRIFEEYIESLKIDLSFQDVQNELETLPGKYSEPKGCIILGYSASKVIGCVALRPLNETICEMKRLYVRDEYKGSGIGKELVRRVLDEAQTRGYEYIRLDTLQSMGKARALYKSMGFYEIEPYVYNPIEGTMYLEKSIGHTHGPASSL